MAKTVSLPFDLSNIVLAFDTAEAHANAFDAMCADMVQWHAAGVFPSNADVKAALVQSGRPATTAAVYASAILKWARSGKLPKTLRACVNSSPEGHVKSKRGRPAGKGAGKTTTVTADNSDAAVDPISAGGAGDAPSPMHRWMRQLNDFRQGVFILRDAKNECMTAEDATRAQNLAAELTALLGKYTA